MRGFDDSWMYFSTHLATQAADLLQSNDVDAEVIDLRVLNPLEPAEG